MQTGTKSYCFNPLQLHVQALFPGRKLLLRFCFVRFLLINLYLMIGQLITLNRTHFGSWNKPVLRHKIKVYCYKKPLKNLLLGSELMSSPQKPQLLMQSSQRFTFDKKSAILFCTNCLCKVYNKSTCTNTHSTSTLYIMNFTIYQYITQVYHMSMPTLVHSIKQECKQTNSGFKKQEKMRNSILLQPLKCDTM